MTTLASRISEVQAALDALARQHKVPGASLGILSGDELVEFVTGVANRNTGVPVTTTTLFQIGSNTKVYTATLVMQLVDDGLLDLDVPVRRYLSDLQLADSRALGKITTRMLLTHSSGIEGDHFGEYGRGDESIEKYVGSLSEIGQIHPPGEMWTYCNTGFNLLGYLAEKLRGEPYAKLMAERIVKPLGLTRTTVLMEDMLAHSCAVGHVMAPGASEPTVPGRVMMSPSHAPAGSMTVSTPSEVLRFVRMHIDGGRARDGTPVLQPATAKAMQQPQVKMPSFGLGKEMGLGWMLDEWDGERVLAHGGNTIGQSSYLKVLPDRPFAVCLLTNSSTGGALFRDLGRFVFDELAGVHMPDTPKLPQEPPKVDLSRYEAMYRRHGLDIELKAEDDHLVATIQGTGELSEGPPQTWPLRPVDADTFLANVMGTNVVAQFLDFDARGRPRYIHIGARASRRVASAAKAKPSKGKAKAKAKAKAKSRPKAKARPKARAATPARGRTRAKRRPARRS